MKLDKFGGIGDFIIINQFFFSLSHNSKKMIEELAKKCEYP